jgi:putative CocE/NonD family hydrolase
MNTPMPTPMQTPMDSDLPADFKPCAGTDHQRREERVAMRDGVKLHTVIIIPQGAADAPMVLDRTPYAAAKWTRQTGSVSAAMAMYAFQAELLLAGTIVVVQDIRGKHKSEGDYVLNRPLRGPLNATETDHATDAFDTIEWLVNNVPESNGRVATMGVSYDGFTTLMSLVDPHPALKCAVPINPMVDNWVGDDWFHNGAFRQMLAAQYLYVQTASRASEVPWPHFRYDEFETWLEAGNAAEMGRRLGMDALPAWRRMLEHPDYDGFWQQQAVDRVLVERLPTPLQVPTMHVHSQWDSEDSYGVMAAHAAMEPKDAHGDRNLLVIGPWSHPGVGMHDGASLGPLKFGSDTARWFRRELMLPFLDQHLRPGPGSADLARVTAFETGSNTWRRHEHWPPRAVQARPLFLQASGGLSFSAPVDGAGDAFDEYVSDPAKPVPYQPRPIRPKGAPGARWDDWLVDDQRFADGRPDVLSYRSPPLTEALHLAGQPVAHLFAATSGTDCDWVVKLIDVYPDNVPGDPTMGSFQLPVAMEILRGRYREDPSRPTPITPGEVLHVVIRLPHVAHAFLPGHRLMVQIQSSWFPLYDRNPQSFVPNIFFAPPEAYVKATQRIVRTPQQASCIHLPVLA